MNHDEIRHDRFLWKLASHFHGNNSWHDVGTDRCHSSPMIRSAYAHRCAEQMIKQPYQHVIYVTIRHLCSQHLLARMLQHVCRATSLNPETRSFLVHWDRNHLLPCVEISQWKKKTEVANRLKWNSCNYKSGAISWFVTEISVIVTVKSEASTEGTSKSATEHNSEPFPSLPHYLTFPSPRIFKWTFS